MHGTPQNAVAEQPGVMMNRRVFLKLTGLVAVAGASTALPAATGWRSGAGSTERAHDFQGGSGSSGTQLAIHEAGTYRISGSVRIEEPLVAISGIGDTQWLSWSDAAGAERPMSGFTTFMHFDGPGMTPAIHVQGGRLEALTAVPVVLG
jgi:hypothetical protein